MFFTLFLCLNIPFLGVWITVKQVSEKGYYEQKKIFLKSLALVLDAHLDEGGYDKILEAAGTQSASREEKIIILNKALAASTDLVAEAAAGIGAGFYSKDLDAIITYGPAKEFGEKVGVSIAPEHQGRLVMADGIERLAQGSMVRGNILNMMHPVKRKGKIIGYIWVNEATTDIEKGLRKVSRSIMIFVGIFYVLMTVCVGLIFRRTIVVERKALTAAESANSAQKNFLAQMSHEIRTPLNGIIGVSDLLQRTEVSDKQKEYTDLLRTSANHLLTLINDILDFSKIEAGKLELEHIKFDLIKTVETVRQILLSKTMEKNLELECICAETLPRIVFGDPVRIRQILVNLLNNAIKFTEQGSIRLTVSVEASPAELPEDVMLLHFAVKDTGIGIAPDRIDRLFSEFVQVDASQTRKFGGTGLGLAISKQLVQLMGGTIGVDSVEHQGSTFYFTIPFQIAAETDFETDESLISSLLAAGTDTQALDGEILLAEDNLVNQIVFSEVLSLAGFKFDVVANGKQALDAFLKKDYALILMDCQMPEMDGYEASRQIRQTEQHLSRVMPDGSVPRPIPIIALTANAAKEDENLCLAAGMNDYCIKPVTPARLIQMIRKWLKKDEEKSG
ncbi:MAG: response regulator [Planctomycetaceae bacterium]|nr:response regulator [Planctomycetaceae bacterium]